MADQEQSNPEQPTFEQHSEHEPATEEMADAWFGYYHAMDKDD